MIKRTVSGFLIPAHIDYDVDTGKIIAVQPDWEALNGLRVDVVAKDDVCDERLKKAV